MVGGQMPNKQNREKTAAFLNLGLTEDLDKRLTAYCLERMQRNHMVKHGLKTKIAREALREWLDNHENDFDLEL